MAKAGTVAVLLPGAFYFIRETRKPPVELFRKHGTRIAIATDCNPGSSPLTSLLLTMNMGATLFRLTVDEIIAGVTREAAQALGRARRGRHAGSRQVVRPRHLERRAAGRAALSHGVQSAAPAGVERAVTSGADPVKLGRGPVSLDEWRAILRGAAVALDPACRPAVEASARAVEAIVAKGEPVYGINTGFGKLASVRIEPADIARLQTNIVLSHAAGVGEPAPANIVRLMLALKLASLAQGASGVRPATMAMLEAMLAKGLMPVVPCAGLGRRLGRSGAARAHGGGDDRRRRDRHAGRAQARRRRRCSGAGLAPLALGPKEGLALLNGTQFSTAYALAALFASANLLRTALITGVLSTEAAKGSDAPFDARIHALRRHRGQIDCADALRRLMAGSAIRASHLVGDDRVQDPYCLRCQPQVMGAVLDTLRHVASVLGDEANGVSDNPLIFAEDGDRALRRQLPRRAGGARRRHDGAGDLRDRLAGRAAHRHAGRSGAVAAAGVPDAEAGPQLRLHDPAGDGRGARVREQAARGAGQHRLPSRPPPTRKTTSRWPRTRRGACCRWRRT